MNPAATPINPGEKSDGNVGKGEQARVRFQVEDGITVQLCVKEGRIVFYASVVMTPSEAFYDWKIVTEVGCTTAHLDTRGNSGGNRRKRQAADEQTLYVTIEGDAEGENSFSLDSDVSKPG